MFSFNDAYAGINYDVAEESAASIYAIKTPVDCDVNTRRR
jgi:hypothetical protein